MDQLKNQPCPLCHQNKLTLIEEEYDVPYFGKCYLMLMKCENCDYHVSDIEAEESREPSRYTFELDNKIYMLYQGNQIGKFGFGIAQLESHNN